MENLETQADISKVSSVHEKSEQSNRTVSILKKSNRSMLKSVSFIGSVLGISKDTEDSAKATSNVEILPKKIQSNTTESYSNDSNIYKQSDNLSVSLAQANLDTSSKLIDTEKSIEQHEETSYIGWDGYQERFDDATSTESIPHCIPPWAKSMRKKYGLTTSSSHSQEYMSHDDGQMKDKIRQLMNKYNDLMLVKRVESKKQVVVEQGKNRDDIDTVKSKTMHTRYYLAPLSKGDIKKQEVDDGQTSTNIANSSLHLDNISLTKRTTKTQAKREVQGIIHPTMKTSLERHHGYGETRDQRKCQKLTLSNIRDYVNAQSMTPDQRKLHEIIKIETVPSISSEKKDRGPSKYIINVPQSKPTDGATINVIKIKEKRKLRVESVEDIREKTTELHYSSGIPQKQEVKKRTPDEIREHAIGKTVKSPTETKTFQVTSKTTPHIAPCIEAENNSDKVLLIQYEKKSAKDKSKDAKQPKYTTKLLGVRRPALDESEEMYLYESETCGGKQNEYSTKVEGVHPNLKEKLNSIFDELKGLKPKGEILPDTVCSEAQVKPDQSDYSSQGPLEPIGTDAVSIQAMPDVKSVEIQVRESLLYSGFIAPHPSPHSGYLPDEPVETDKRLEKTSKYLIGYAEDQSELEHEDIIGKKSLTEDEDTTKQFDEEGKRNEPEKDSDKYEEMRQSTRLSDQQTKDKEKFDEEISDELTDEQVKKDRKSTLVELLPDSGKLDEKLEPTPDKQLDETKDEELDVGDELGISKDTGALSDDIPDQKKADKSEDEHLSISKDQPTGDDDKVQIKSVTSSKIPKEESKEEKGDKDGKDGEKSQEDIIRNLESLGAETETETSGIKIDEDIRSYNLDGFRDTKLTFTSPSKFLHKKNSIRKRLNWSDDTLYLEKHLCPQLVRGLAETAMRRPADPVAFLAHWIYKDYQNREQAEVEAVHQEHRQLERTMCDVQRPAALVQKKFKLKKYPVPQVTPINSEKAISERALTLESLKGGTIENEIAQEA